MTNGPNAISMFWRKCRKAGYLCGLTQFPIGDPKERWLAVIHAKAGAFFAYGSTQSAACAAVIRKAGL